MIRPNPEAIKVPRILTTFDPLKDSRDVFQVYSKQMNNTGYVKLFCVNYTVHTTVLCVLYSVHGTDK